MICYYSNYCDPSKQLLQKIAKTKLQREIHFLCIDRRKRDPKGNTFLVLDKEQVLLPPSVTRVPALYLMESKKVLFGDDISQFLLPKEAAITHQVTNGNGEPECYSISQLSKISDSYSFWDQTADDLSAKGSGGMRQLHGFSTLDEQYSIHAPPEDYVPDKIGKSGKSLEEYKAERDNLVPMVKRV